MAKFQMGVTINPFHINKTARVADGAGAGNQLGRVDNGKLVKLIADSQYGLCAAGNEIEGVLDVADDLAPQDGFNLGSVRDAIGTRLEVTLDGLQATPGTGTVAVGDYVVAGTATARGTALSVPPKVCKATNAGNTLVYKWRVMSLKTNGNVGSVAIIERVA